MTCIYCGRPLYQGMPCQCFDEVPVPIDQVSREDRERRYAEIRAAERPGPHVDGVCPACGDECHREEADVGVGVIYGPWGCACGWSQDPEYDSRFGPNLASLADAGRHVTPTGVSYSKERLKENVARLGLDPGVIDEVFGPGG